MVYIVKFEQITTVVACKNYRAVTNFVIITMLVRFNSCAMREISSIIINSKVGVDSGSTEACSLQR